MTKMTSGQAFEILVRKLVKLVDNSLPAVENKTDGSPPSPLHSAHKIADSRDRMEIWMALRSIGLDCNDHFGFPQPLDDQIAMFHDADHFETERAAKAAINNEVIAYNQHLSDRVQKMVGLAALGEHESLVLRLQELYFSIQRDTAQRKDTITPKPARSHPRVPRNEPPRIPRPDEQWGDSNQDHPVQ